MALTPRSRSVLIVGGGFIGRSLLDSASDENHAVLVSKFGAPVFSRFSNFEIVASFDNLDDSRRWDTVVYCAGPSRPALVTSRDVAVYTSAFNAALNSCRRARCFVYVSSGGMFYKPSYEPHTEKDLVDVDSPYTEMHYLNEIMLSQFDDIQSRLVFRLGNPFGKYQDPVRSVGFVSQTVIAALTGRKLQVFGAGDARRDFFHVSSFVDLVMSPRVSDVSGYDVFNFGSGVSRSLVEVIDAVEVFFGKKINYEFVGSEQPSRHLVSLDISKLRRSFPGVFIPGLEDGLRKFAANAIFG